MTTARAADKGGRGTCDEFLRPILYTRKHCTVRKQKPTPLPWLRKALRGAMATTKIVHRNLNSTTAMTPPRFERSQCQPLEKISNGCAEHDSEKLCTR